MNVLLRDIRDSDIELVMAWRSNERVYQGMYTQKEPLVWEEHLAWWKSRFNWKRWVIQVNDGSWTRDVGIVQFGQLDHWRPELGIAVGEISLWGKGVATQALLLACDWAKEKGYSMVSTTILETNLGSIKAFEKVGFVKKLPARPGEWYYELSL